MSVRWPPGSSRPKIAPITKGIATHGGGQDGGDLGDLSEDSPDHKGDCDFLQAYEVEVHTMRPKIAPITKGIATQYRKGKISWGNQSEDSPDHKGDCDRELDADAGGVWYVRR